MHAVQLFGFVFASNHVHLLLRAPQGNLAGFMQFLLGNVARKVGRANNWAGHLWERRYAAAPVLDGDALVERLGYILAHGAKEGLVRRCAEWPGISCLRQLLGSSVRAVHWFNWSRRARVRSRRDKPSLVDPRFAEPEHLEVHPLPSWAGLTSDERTERVRAIVHTIEQDAARAHPTPLGVSGVLAQRPDTKPRLPKRGPAPLCHSSDPTLRAHFRLLYMEAVRSVRGAIVDLHERFRPVRLPSYDVRLFLWPTGAAVAA